MRSKHNYIINLFYFQIQVILEKCKSKSILVAISGGQDSICLIHLFETFVKYSINHNKQKIEYIYIDHQWKKDSYTQIKHIINYIKLYNRHIHIYQIKSINMSESISRQYRYHTIIQHAIYHNFYNIVTGHTKTDIIETFLHNLIRGTSLEGIAGLNKYKKLDYKIYLIKPLNHTNRTFLYNLSKKFFLPIWSDITNYNYLFCRNRMRNELIPYLKNYFNKNLENQLFYFLKIINNDNEYLKQNTTKIYIESVHKYYLALNYIKIKYQHFALQTRIIQLFFYHNLNISLNYKIYKKIFKLINSNTKKKYILKYLTYKIYINEYWIYII